MQTTDSSRSSRRSGALTTLFHAGLAITLAGCPDDDPDEGVVVDAGLDTFGDVVTVDLPAADQAADLPDTSVEGFVFTAPRVDGHSLDALAPDTTYTLALDYQVWNAPTCVGCVRQVVVQVGAEAPADCAFEGAAAAFPGESGTASISFTTPATPGSVAVVAMMQDEDDCAGAIEDALSEPDEFLPVATLTVVVPFEVVAIAPGDEAEGVDIDEVVVVTFSRDVDPASLTTGARIEGPDGDVAGRWLGAGTEITFQPTELLTERRAEYDVSLGAAVVSTGIPSPLLPFESSFTTQLVSDDFTYALADGEDAATAPVLSTSSAAPALVSVSAMEAGEGAAWVFEELAEDRYRLTTQGWGSDTALEASSSTGPVSIATWNGADAQRWYFTEVADDAPRFWMQNDALGDDWVLSVGEGAVMIPIAEADEDDGFVPLRGDSLE